MLGEVNFHIEALEGILLNFGRLAILRIEQLKMAKNPPLFVNYKNNGL